MMKLHPNKQYLSHKGYTLLFAVIAASLVLGVGVFILGVSKKQFALSVAARESMYALYAADSGIECAAREYNYNTSDSSGTGLAVWTTVDETSFHVPSIECNGESYSASTEFEEVDTPDTNLWDNSQPVYQAGDIPVFFDASGSLSDSCALITVAYGTDLKGDSVVRITSRGYNQCDSSGPIPSSRTVERALRLTASN